jgi:hypothetical protein
MKRFKQFTYEAQSQIYTLNKTGMGQNKIANHPLVVSFFVTEVNN